MRLTHSRFHIYDFWLAFHMCRTVCGYYYLSLLPIYCKQTLVVLYECSKKLAHFLTLSNQLETLKWG